MKAQIQSHFEVYELAWSTVGGTGKNANFFSFKGMDIHFQPSFQ